MSLTIEQIGRDIEAYRDLLDRCVEERDLHAFLANHSYASEILDSRLQKAAADGAKQESKQSRRRWRIQKVRASNFRGLQRYGKGIFDLSFALEC
jgi:hypothetical protein